MLAGTGFAGCSSNSHAWQVAASCWWEVYLSSSHVSLLPIPVVPSRVSSVRETGRRINAAYDIASEVSTITSSLFFWSHRISHNSVWERTMQRHKYQKARIIDGYFRD